MDSKILDYVSAQEAVKSIQSGDRVFIHSVAAAPQELIRAMTAAAPELCGVEIVHLHTEGEAPYAAPAYAESFRTNALFVGENIREAVQAGRADYVPVFLSEVPRLFRKGVLPLDVALIQVSPPDRHGYCSLGVSVDGSPAALTSHRRLGVHTEMFSDGVIELVRRGVITGEDKVIEPRRIVAGFVHGTQQLYDFIHENPSVHLHDISYVNDTAIIRQNPKVTAINSAIEVDLTGQVCADSIGSRQYSGVGGQMDFIRGAALSEGGKPIIALPSTSRKGLSRIVPLLQPGAGVTTTRAHVHYIVTEYGVANLYGKNLRQRARALIDIAHPAHRAALAGAAAERFGI